MSLAISFYNTLTHRVEPFEPIEPGKVSMYNCGPTVYDYAHIGNFKTFLFADVLRRFLELAGHDVVQVMNITDVGHMTEDSLADGGGEDKFSLAIRRMKQSKAAGDPQFASIDNPDDPYQIADFYTIAFLEDAKLLGIKVAGEYPDRMPKATDHVTGHMIPMIQQLVAKEHAYVADDGAVYFAVETFDQYGKLSGNTIDRLRGGAGGRVTATNQAGKRHPADFLLWKPDASHIMKWDSPWGVGYPGWHIECSAMARAVLDRDVIDIHTGGEDNIFPHHECEIAQSCGVTGQSSFANFWMHSRHLMVEGQKMSKSAGNFFTVRDVLAGKVTGHPVDPAVMRLAMIRGHYRSNLDFSARSLEESAGAVRKLRESAEHWSQQAQGQTAQVDDDHPAMARFLACLGDDLNVAGAIGVLFEYLANQQGDTPAIAGAVVNRMDRVLGLLPQANQQDATAGGDGMDVDQQCAAIDAARAAKDYDAADRIRDQLIDAGYEVKTTKNKTVASRRLA